MNQRRRATIIFVVALSAVTLWFCYLIARPFLESLFFAVVLAIVFSPLHVRLHRRIRSANAAALVSTLCVLFKHHRGSGLTLLTFDLFTHRNQGQPESPLEYMLGINTYVITSSLFAEIRERSEYD